MTSTTPNHTLPWGTEADFARTGDSATVRAESRSGGSRGRPIEGATAESYAVPVDALTLAAQQINLPPCPEELRNVIEDTSLERLVYWKLQGLFDKFDEEPPHNILKTVLAHVERPLFALVLKKTKGNQSKAAEVLGCNRNTLHRKLKGFAIEPRDLRRALKIRDRKGSSDSLGELSVGQD